MNSGWQVIYYETLHGDIPVKSFLNRANPRLKAKALRILLQLEEYGLQTIIPHIKKLSGLPFWEIRILGEGSARILFVTQIGEQIILLHAFYKKTQKTPLKEIAIVRMRLKEFQNR